MPLGYTEFEAAAVAAGEAAKHAVEEIGEAIDRRRQGVFVIIEGGSAYGPFDNVELADAAQDRWPEGTELNIVEVLAPPDGSPVSVPDEQTQVADAAAAANSETAAAIDSAPDAATAVATIQEADHGPADMLRHVNSALGRWPDDPDLLAIKADLEAEG